MKHSHVTARTLLVCLLVLCALTTGAFAADISVTAASGYCFSAADFSAGGSAPDGVYLASVPDASVCTIRYGSRTLRAGDVIASSALCSLTLEPAYGAMDSAALVYCPISSGSVGQMQTINLNIRTGKNRAPEAESLDFETYKNVSNSAALPVSDPDGDTLTYQLVKAPKRGTVELHEDGTFTYTPKENKVGKDSFTFTATDAAGNVSNEGTVKIKIVKPTDKAYYTDMAADPDEYLAMWLKERGVYTGKTVAGNVCFEPDGAVGRGEFLVMAMTLLGAQAEDAELTSGFADEALTPGWMRPYIVSAFKSGMISGVSSEAGMLFRPSASLTGAEAAVMLQNMLQLPETDSKAVFAADEEESAVPAWAQSAVSTLLDAGVSIPATTSAEPISRRDAARLLYDVCQLAERGDATSFYCAK